MTKEKCLHCGHEWNTRTDKPKSCPNCKRYNWYKKLEEKELDKK